MYPQTAKSLLENIIVKALKFTGHLLNFLSISMYKHNTHRMAVITSTAECLSLEPLINEFYIIQNGDHRNVLNTAFAIAASSALMMFYALNLFNKGR